MLIAIFKSLIINALNSVTYSEIISVYSIKNIIYNCKIAYYIPFSYICKLDIF